MLPAAILLALELVRADRFLSKLFTFGNWVSTGSGDSVQEQAARKLLDSVSAQEPFDLFSEA
jgi:hypothetical protein